MLRMVAPSSTCRSCNGLRRPGWFAWSVAVESVMGETSCLKLIGSCRVGRHPTLVPLAPLRPLPCAPLCRTAFHRPAVLADDGCRGAFRRPAMLADDGCRSAPLRKAEAGPKGQGGPEGGWKRGTPRPGNPGGANAVGGPEGAAT